MIALPRHVNTKIATRRLCRDDLHNDNRTLPSNDMILMNLKKDYEMLRYQRNVEYQVSEVASGKG